MRLRRVWPLLLLPGVAWSQFLYRGSGDSMLPAVPAGSILAVYPYRYESLKVGQLVMRKRSDGDIVHRLHRHVRGHGWVTKGDNNASPDAGYMAEADFAGIAFVVTPEGRLTDGRFIPGPPDGPSHKR